MTSTSDYEYQVGGSLPVDAPSYVKRQADEDFYTGLKSGEFCYVLNARQMGKSSLRVRTAQRLQADGIICGWIDLTEIGTQDVTSEQWYAGVFRALVSSFKLKKFKWRPWWREREILSPVQRLSDFIEEELLVRFAENLVIFIDEIDSILSLKFSVDDFFALIRSSYNKRVDNPSYKRLTFALLGVATPSDLIQDKRRTPFNIGRAIELQGFQLYETKPLQLGFSGKVQNTATVMAEILAWTGGQPFLTQKLCEQVRKSNLIFSEGQEAESIGKIVRSQMIENWEFQDEPEHLRTIRDRILKHEKQIGRLLELYLKIWQQGDVPIEQSLEQMELRLTGLVVSDTGKIKVYNRVYQEVFNLNWIQQILRELRPYTEALDAWEKSGRQDESRLLKGEALKEAKRWATGKSLSDQDYQFLDASSQLEHLEIQATLFSKLAAEQQANQILSQAKKRASTILKISLAVLAGSVGIAGLYIKKADHNLNLAEIHFTIARAKELSILGQERKSILTALQASQNLMKKVPVSLWSKMNTQGTVMTVLHQVLDQPQEQNSIEGHQDSVLGVAFSPTGDLIATASRDNTVKLWQADGTLVKTLEEHQDSVLGVAFSPTGEMIATASSDNTVKLWKSDGTLVRTLEGHQSDVWGVAFSPTGDLIATASWDKTMKLWKPDGTLVRTLEGHQGSVYDVAFSPTGDLIATASSDNTVKLWKPDGTYVRTLEGHQGFVLGVAFSPTGDLIATASSDKTVKLWQADGTLVRTLEGHQDSVWGVAFSPTGEMIATVSSDKTVKLWQADGTLVRTLEGHQDSVWGVAFSPKGDLIATASSDKTVKRWKPDGTFVRTLEGHQGDVWGVVFSPEGDLITTASSAKTVKRWKPDGTLVRTLVGHQNSVWGVTFSPTGDLIATASWDNTVKLWQADGTLVRTLVGHQNSVWGVTFSPKGDLIATASSDKTVKLWKIDGTLVRTIEGHQGSVYGVAFRPKGDLIATASSDKTVKLWKSDGTLVKTIEGHQGSVYDVAFSPTGDLIATASSDKIVKLWTVDLDDLIAEGCGWVHDYLRNNPNVSEDERRICGVEASATALFLQGEQLATDGNMKEAVSRFQQAVKLDPNFSLDSAKILVKNGKRLAREDKLDEAIFALQTALEFDSSLNFERIAREIDRYCFDAGWRDFCKRR